MSQLLLLSGTPLVQAIGWAFIHFFLWQGSLIGTGLWALLTSMRRRSADSRYAACLVGMILMLLAPAVTVYLVLRGMSGPWSYAPHGIFPLVGGSGLTSDWLKSLIPWLTGLWILGAFSFQVRLIVKLICAERIKRTGLTTAPERLQRDLEFLIDRLGITRVVHIMESALVAVPSVIGWLSPIVLVPAGIVTRLTPIQIRGIIAHELAHIRRNDYIVNLIQNLFESLLFFHPMTWWVSSRLRIEREFSCDDVALSVSDSPLQYAKALSNLEELRQQESSVLTTSTGGSLMNRIARIFGRGNVPVFGKAIWLAPLVLIVGAFGVIAMIGTGCESGSGTEAIAALQDVEAEADVAGPTIAQASDLRDEILRKLQEAVERGDITEEEAAKAVKMVEGNMDCLSSCPEGAMAVLCAREVGPDCCPDGVVDICCERIANCGETVDVQTIQIGKSEGCTGVVVCVRNQDK